MKTNDRKSQLQQQISVLSNELSEITSAEKVAAHKGLVGHCYKYHNSSGASSPKWWLYMRVISIDECGYLTQFQFESRPGDNYQVESKTFCCSLLEGYNEISQLEFVREYAKLLGKLEALLP